MNTNKYYKVLDEDDKTVIIKMPKISFGRIQAFFEKNKIIPKSKEKITKSKKSNFQKAMEDYENGINIFDHKDFLELMTKRWVTV